jgi:hypothetical protein
MVTHLIFTQFEAVLIPLTAQKEPVLYKQQVLAGITCHNVMYPEFQAV